MNIKFVAIAVISAGLAVSSNGLFAQTSPGTEEIRAYHSVGRIKWKLPSGFDYGFAVPHYTMGPRIQCKGPVRHCEIGVAARDITVTLEQRRKKLSAELAPYVERSKEKAIQIRTFGTAPEVTYATLTDTKPGPGEFLILTRGFSLNGPALINFEHLSNDPNDVRRMLEVVQAAVTMDVRETWAWKLDDYKAVCEGRFPAYKHANDAAFKSSPFSAVDIIAYWKARLPSASTEEVRTMGERSRKSYAEMFDARPALEKQDFCKSFPTWVAEAAKGINSK